MNSIVIYRTFKFVIFVKTSDTYNKYKNLKYIDLSADFRLKTANVYFKNYKIKHNAKKLQNINDSIQLEENLIKSSPNIKSFYITEFFAKIKNRAFYGILAYFCIKKHNYAYKKCADSAENWVIC